MTAARARVTNETAQEPNAPACAGELEAMRLLDTQRAFDSVAADYDGPRGNNALIQRMRRSLWETVQREVSSGSRLLDLGCGTGIDALHFAQLGHSVVATDWSPGMTARTRARVADASPKASVEVRQLGIHQLGALDDRFDGIYSNFGPLNCAPDLADTAGECARLLAPGGVLVVSVMGRLCPWELAHYALRGRFSRVAVRAARGVTPVGMNRHTIWTRYYFPREFHRHFDAHFTLDSHRALSLFLPPPYLIDTYRRHQALYDRLGRLDDRIGDWPLLRGMGDHFLMVLRRR